MSTLPSMAGLAHRGPERRRHTRFRIIERQLVTVDLGAKQRGVLVDISSGGAAVQPYEPLQLGETTELAFPVPGEHSRIEAKGVVTWLGPTGRAGIQFVDVADSAQPYLNGWIESLSARAPERSDSVVQSTAAYLPPSYSPWIKVGDVNMESGTLEDELSSLDLVSALRMVVERARSLTRASGAAIALSDGADMVCRARTGVAPDLGARFRPESGLSGETVRTGAIVRCADTASDPRVDRAACERLNVRSILIVPILAADAVIGVIEVFSPQPGAFSDRDQLHAQRLAELTSAMLENGSDVGRLPAMDARQDNPRTEVAAIEPEPFEPAALEPPGSLDPSPQTELSSSEIVDIYNQFTRKNDEPDRRREIIRKTTLYTIVFLVLMGSVFGVSRWSRAKQHMATSAPVVQPRPVADNPAVVELPLMPEPQPVSANAEPGTANSKAKPGKKSAGTSETERWTWIAPLTPGSSSQLRLDSFQLEPAPGLKAAASGQVRLISDMAAPVAPGTGKLLSKVEPMFPPAVSTQSLHGNVVLKFTVNASGTVDDVELVSGNALLGAAAVQAIKKWRYEPFVMEGHAIPIQKTITISFAR